MRLMKDDTEIIPWVEAGITRKSSLLKKTMSNINAIISNGKVVVDR